MSTKVHLVIIDPQVDFCDPAIGTLVVPGAMDDMKRLAQMITRLSKRDVFDDIHITLDSHHFVHIAHPIYWKNSRTGKHPEHFTQITREDVDKGTWQPNRLSLLKRSQEYVRLLDSNGRYPLVVWPPHCLIGTPGHLVVPPLMQALLEWESQFNVVNKITKGSNIYTEHYSAVQADVPDPTDPSTSLNVNFLQTLQKADIIALAGEAGSHCLANTVRDVVNNFVDDSLVGKLVLLTDATSPVKGFEHLQDQFIKEMTEDRKAAGKTPMKLSTTKEFLS